MGIKTASVPHRGAVGAECWVAGRVRDLAPWGLAGWWIWDILREGKRERILLDPRNRLQTSVVLGLQGPTPGFTYARALSDIALLNRPSKLLILGGGGGAIPIYLARKLPDTAITVVELRRELESVAKIFFGAKERDFDFVHSDAEEYLKTPCGTYDGIIADVFGESGLVPCGLLELESLRNMRKALKPGGWLAWNLSIKKAGAWKRAVSDAMATLNKAGLSGRVWTTPRGRPTMNAVFLHGGNKFKPGNEWRRRYCRVPWRRGKVRSQSHHFRWPESAL